MDGAEYVGDIPDESDGEKIQNRFRFLSTYTFSNRSYTRILKTDMIWEVKDINDVLGVEKEIASRLERHLSTQDVKADSPKKQANRIILKGQSTREVEEDEEEDEYEYDYELEELLVPGERDLSHLRGKARKRGKRAKRKYGR